MLRVLFCFGLFLLTEVCFAQKAVSIDSSVAEHIFAQKDIEWLEDPKDNLSISEITGANYVLKFKPNTTYYPRNYQHSSSYWYRIKIKYLQPISEHESLFELFDQTTDQIFAYLPDKSGKYQEFRSGQNFRFRKRLFSHKNFEFPIKNLEAGERTYYFKIKSSERVNVIIVYRTISRFIYYTLTEYITYGIFYGMILIFCFHNLLMYLAIKRRQYLVYVLYILSVGLYEMSSDGIGFQYLWPNTPVLNDYIFGIALYLISVFALLFTKELLQLKSRNVVLNRVVNWTILLRTVFFCYCLLLDRTLFMAKFIDFVPLSVAFFSGIVVWRNGFKPARFFVLAYSVLCVGFVMKGLFVLGFYRFLPAVIAHYSVSFSFVLEMVFLSFAIGDQVRLFRKEKDLADDQVIHQLKENAGLKDFINLKLENEVAARTREVIEHTEEIQKQAKIITSQNEKLQETNRRLEVQAEEISRINALLTDDNVQLKTHVEKVTDARAFSTELSYEEFNDKYPDKDTCYKMLSELKWFKGFSCIKCGNESYCGGRMAYSRRCTKCSYEESVLHHTIFQNNRLPINKAFYLVYLVYTNHGDISSWQLAEKMNIRQGTCWAYATKIKAAMVDKKKLLKDQGSQGWKSLILSSD